MPRYTAYYHRDDEFDGTAMFRAENDDAALTKARRLADGADVARLDRCVTVFEQEKQDA